MEHQISLNAAAEMTSRYRSNREAILQSEYQSLNLLPVCETFDKESVVRMLNETGAAKLRIYYGMKEDMRVHAVLVAADAAGADILPSGTSLTSEDPIVILEDAQRCPPYCPPTSPLNEDID
jgi:hypothetical protein